VVVVVVVVVEEEDEGFDCMTISTSTMLNHFPNYVSLLNSKFIVPAVLCCL